MRELMLTSRAKALGLMQDDKTYDDKNTRSMASNELVGVGGQCLDVKLYYLHNTHHSSSLYTAIIYGDAIAHGNGYRIRYATKEYLELKV
jgi:hypothetical protein